MKEFLIKNIHLFIFAYAAFGLYGIYEEKMLALEQAKQQTPGWETKIKKAKKKLSDIDKFKQNLSTSKERVKEVVKQIEKVQRQLPADVNDTEVQELVGNIAKELRIQNPAPSPSNETLNGFYFAKDYVFTGKGTFLQFLILFEKIAKAERILNVKKVIMAYDENNMRSRFQVLQIQAVVESFRYNPNYKESANVQ